MNKLEREINSIERFVFDGEKFPNGRSYDYQREESIHKNWIPKIVDLYDKLRDSNKDKSNLMQRIYYLARDQDEPEYERRRLKFSLEPVVFDSLIVISSEGRKLSLQTPKTEEERIKLAKLYDPKDFLYNRIFAAQIQDPKRGCSASKCSNCDEPVAFCITSCHNCSYALIGAHGMPTLKIWERANINQRLQMLKRGFNHTIEDVRQRGDWRSNSSPFNDYKPEGVSWGAPSRIHGGTPLRRASEFGYDDDDDD